MPRGMRAALREAPRPPRVPKCISLSNNRLASRSRLLSTPGSPHLGSRGLLHAGKCSPEAIPLHLSSVSRDRISLRNPIGSSAPPRGAAPMISRFEFPGPGVSGSNPPFVARGLGRTGARGSSAVPTSHSGPQPAPHLAPHPDPQPAPGPRSSSATAPTSLPAKPPPTPAPADRDPPRARPAGSSPSRGRARTPPSSRDPSPSRPGS